MDGLIWLSTFSFERRISMEMTAAEEIFADALELTDPVERAALLDRACGQDAELRAQVEALLAAPALAAFASSMTLTGVNACASSFRNASAREPTARLPVMVWPDGLRAV